MLAEQLAEARAGRPAVVLLGGDPGIGKTRLLEEFPPAELAEGATVLRGGASQSEGMPPYLPFVEALGEYAAAVPADVLREQLVPPAASLAMLLPEIPARLGLPAPLHSLGPEQERFRLYEAVAAFLAEIAARGPLILLLDDLQWTDAASFDLLVHVASRSRSRAVALLLVGAYREGEAEENPAFVRARAELNRRRLLVTLSVPRLEAEDSRALAANALRGPVAPDVADLLHRHSEGNPFFLEELLRTLVDEEGTLVWRNGRWELASHPRNLLPPRVAEAIRMRLTRLDPAVVALLRVAAVAGRAFEPALLAQVLGLDVEQTEEHLQPAARAQLVRPEADGTYAFTHDMVRETLYADVGRARRRRLHQAIGEALEMEGDASSARRLADLAFHFAEAGEPARGATYAQGSGEQALRASAPLEAIAHFRTALRLLSPSGESRQRASALMGLGDAATLAGEYPQAAEAYQAAQASWLHSGDARAAARAAYRLGRVRWRQEALVDARAAFERAMQLLGDVACPEAAETLLPLADLHVTSLGQHAEGMVCVERALAMVTRLGDRRLEATARMVEGNVKARGDELAAGRLSLERALALAQELDDPALAAEACAYLANAHAFSGDYERSRKVSLLRAELARRSQDFFHLRHVYSWIGHVDTLLGKWRDAQHWFAQQEQVIAGLQSPEPWASLHLARGIMLYFQARSAEAEQELRAVDDLVRPVGRAGLVWHLGWLGRTLAELGRYNDALDCLTELHALAEGLDERTRARGMAFAQLAVGYARLGAREQAAGCYPKLLPFQGQLAPVVIDRALGLAALAGGDVAAARRHLVAAEAEARSAGMHPELALTLLQRGLLERQLLAGGGRARSATASGPLAEGLRLCTELGMQELGRRILRPVPAASGRGSQRRASLAGPSRRELDVLRLVADGRTNREIAATLVLSENTVARHLTNIFTKIGAENRAGATAFALRHGLA